MVVVRVDVGLDRRGVVASCRCVVWFRLTMTVGTSWTYQGQPVLIGVFQRIGQLFAAA